MIFGIHDTDIEGGHDQVFLPWEGRNKMVEFFTEDGGV